MPPRLRLPPLPSTESWSLYFPRTSLHRPPDAFSSKEYPGRTFLTNPTHTDEFVRALKLRPNDLVIDSWAGPGQLTRSLLTGGNEDTGDIQENKNAWVGEYAQKHPREYRSSLKKLEEGVEGGVKRKTRVKKNEGVMFPGWTKEWMEEGLTGSDERIGESSSSSTTTSSTSTLSRKREYPIPRHVVAVESASDVMVSGLGLEPDQALPPVLYMDLERDPVAFDFHHGEVRSPTPAEGSSRAGSLPPPVPVYPSVYESNLSLATASPYAWRTLPSILSTKGIAEHLDVANEGDALEGERGQRKWTAEPPNVVYVCHLPDSVTGEALAGQWVVSVIGAPEGKAQWAWKWGRMRMALLMGKNLYDRMTARAGENIRCKLSVLTEALYHTEALPPYHHVPNVDRGSIATTARPLTASQNTPAGIAMLETYVGLDLPRTATWPSDFWPIRQSRPEMERQLPRPTLLGLQLIPREKPYVKDDQRDSWEFVLRHCFVRQATPILEGVKSLGFGASSLMKDIADSESVYAGKAVPPEKHVRDLSVEEWARVVDVFHNWAWRPEHLMLTVIGETLEGSQVSAA